MRRRVRARDCPEAAGDMNPISDIAVVARTRDLLSSSRLYFLGQGQLGPRVVGRIANNVVIGC